MKSAVEVKEKQIELLAQAGLELVRLNKETAKWNQIGRRLREYKKGDIVYHDAFGYLEIVTMPEGDSVSLEGVRSGSPYKITCDMSQIELITPVEVRFN